MIVEHPSERAILVHLDVYAPEVREDPYEFQNWQCRQVLSLLVCKCSAATTHCALLIGSGKVEELRQLVLSEQADLVIFNHALTASQEQLRKCSRVPSTGQGRTDSRYICATCTNL